MTKIFCDIADIKLIKKFSKKKLVKGFTTNPTLMRKAGANDYLSYCKKIIKVTKKPISFEVFADTKKEMINQGIKLSKLGKNIYVKVPIVNSRGVLSSAVIKDLNSRNIKLNITAIYTISQVNTILKNINKKTNVIISVFIGRMADAGSDTLPIIKKIIQRCKNYKNVKVLWASVREPYNYLESKRVKCDIITIPPKIIEQIENFGDTPKKLTKDTVKKFLLDSKKSKFKI